MDIQTGVERYLRHHRASGSTAKTIRGYVWVLGKMADYLGGERPLESLEPDDLRGWIVALRERGLAQDSVFTMVRSAKAWSRWLVAEEYLPKDPFAKVRRPALDDKAKPIFTPEEVEAMLRACLGKSRTGNRDFALILLMFSTGLRASEVCGLRVNDVDFDRATITVRRGKGGKFRVVPLTRKVERGIQRYLDDTRRKPLAGVEALFLTLQGEQLTYAALVQAIEVCGKRCGVEANPHKFRHSAAVQYLRNGGRVETLRLLLGHSDLKTTMHYARLAGIDVQQAHDLADPARALKLRV